MSQKCNGSSGTRGGSARSHLMTLRAAQSIAFGEGQRDKFWGEGGNAGQKGDLFSA